MPEAVSTLSFFSRLASIVWRSRSWRREPRIIMKRNSTPMKTIGRNWNHGGLPSAPAAGSAGLSPPSASANRRKNSANMRGLSLGGGQSFLGRKGLILSGRLPPGKADRAELGEAAVADRLPHPGHQPAV